MDYGEVLASPFFTQNPQKTNYLDQTVKGQLIVHKKVGYAFDLTLEAAHHALVGNIVNGKWKVPQAAIEKGLLLGETEIRKLAILDSGETVSGWTTTEVEPETIESFTDFTFAGIYKAEFIYEQDRKLELSYQDWPAEKELWPLTLLLLGLL